MNLLMLSGDSTVAQGQDKAFFQMLRRFSTHWSRIDVICPPAPGATSRVLHGNVYIHPSPHSKIAQVSYIRRKGRELFAQRDYALVTSHDFGLFYNGIGAWWLTFGTGIPYVSEIHHIEGYPRSTTVKERLYRLVGEGYIRWVWPRAAAIRVVNAVEVPDLMMRLGVPKDMILVLPSLYLDFDVFHPMLESPQYDVVFVGRLVANKGIHSLIDSLHQVKATHPNVRLCIVGQGSEQEAVEARIRELDLRDNVTLIPRLNSVEDVARLYNQSRMLVCASTVEGGPRVTVEAMACGTPVISTPVGVMPEILEDGVNGLLWRWDVSELASKIRLLLDDDSLRRRLGEAGRVSVQGFDADTVIANYAHGYHELIARIREKNG